MTNQHAIDDMLATIHVLVAEHIPFNKVLGLTVETLQLDQVSLKLPMRKVATDPAGEHGDQDMQDHRRSSGSKR